MKRKTQKRKEPTTENLRLTSRIFELEGIIRCLEGDKANNYKEISRLKDVLSEYQGEIRKNETAKYKLERLKETLKELLT